MNGGRHNDALAGAEARQDPVPGGPNLGLPVMFLHIPRTGGFTLKTVLETIFGMRNSLLDIHHYPLDVDPRPFAFIEGHVVRDRFSRVFGDGWHTNGLTLLRDPVARVVSQARHIRALRRDPWYPMLASTVDDAEAFFQKVPLLINLQTKQLGGRLPREVSVPASAVEHATSVLDRLAFGLTEQFDTSMALFAERFGLDLPDFGVTNAAPEKGDDDLRSQEFRDAARVYNDRDIELTYSRAASPSTRSGCSRFRWTRVGSNTSCTPAPSASATPSSCSAASNRRRYAAMCSSTAYGRTPYWFAWATRQRRSPAVSRRCLRRSSHTKP